MFDKRLKKFKDIHRGERAFITACGPSLNDVPIEKLENELVFGVSLAYKKEGLKINYHFMGDMNIAEQFYEEINILDNIWFVSDSIYHRIFFTRANTFYFTGHGDKCFYTDVTGRIYGGGTSTFLAMQFAYFMGVQEVFILGLDHYKTYQEEELNIEKFGNKFNATGQPLVVSGGPDKHHFSEDYYGKGIKFYTPTVWKMTESYWMARQAFEKDGRKIWNASTTTLLSEDVLPRIGLENIL